MYTCMHIHKLSHADPRFSKYFKEDYVASFCWADFFHFCGSFSGCYAAILVVIVDKERQSLEFILYVLPSNRKILEMAYYHANQYYIHLSLVILCDFCYIFCLLFGATINIFIIE